ncbi:Ig-like domain-containing protein [Zoogloea sp.]|uniref:Ig-like domain-containing protein n=1 Tax=Zoogloea sp. TaxID=49181 RepID=UPI0035B18921
MSKRNAANPYSRSPLVISGLLALLLAGCGGGGGGSGSSTCLAFNANGVCVNDPTAQTATQLTLTVDTPSIQTDGSSTVTVKAALKDNANAVVSGGAVSFSADSGTLSAPSATTDATTGVATVTFNSDDSKANRTVTITATHKSLVKTITVAIQGTRLGFGGDASGVVGKQVSMSISVLDGAGKAIANQDVALTSKLGNAIPATVRSNSSGQATVTFTPTVSGTDTITATALGATASKDVAISSIDFAFTAPASGVSIPINSCTPVVVQLSGGVSASSVTFTSSRGSVYATAACSAAAATQTVAFAGTAATAYVMSPGAGAATVSAILNGSPAAGTTAKRDVKFVAQVPTQIVVQSDPSTLSPNGTAAVYAVVRDNSGNPVSGSTVIFTAPNGGGTANPSIAYTDDSGVASTTFKADPNLSGKDAVQLVATVNGTSVTASSSLTVAGQGVNMVISTDNQLVKDSDPPRYRSVWGVFVTDSAGNPIKNQAVTISLRGVSFRKGQFTVPDGATKWSPGPTVLCVAEDANNDGFFQTGELGDYDGDGILEPNGAATVMPPIASATQASSVTVTTDNSGSAAFWVVYPPNYAYWTKIELKATAAVAGKNNFASRSFDLPYPASEVLNVDISPSFRDSPFGTDVAGGCKSPN